TTMRRIVSLLVPLFASSIAGCAASAAREDTSSTGSDDALKATAPIPYVLQYTGEYDGDGTGHVDWLVFHANGKVDASVDGRASTVAYTAPRTPGSAALTFKVRGTTYVASVGTS